MANVAGEAGQREAVGNAESEGRKREVLGSVAFRAVGLTIDRASWQNRQFVCSCCGTQAELTWASVRDGEPVAAVYYASCYHHDGVHEAWIDAILGSWATETFDDHVTFGCRVGPVADSPTPAATLVNGGAVAADSPIYGHKLSRDEGLAHPRLAEFWQVVDTVLEHDEVVRQHMYGTAQSS